MRLRRVAVLFWLAALFLWLGMLLLMNRRPPDAGGQALFLLLLTAAVTLTVAPLFLLVRAPRSQAAIIARIRGALVHGVLLGVLAAGLMALQFLRLLNLTTAILLALVVVMLEVLLGLRHRG